jgi:uncharacterized protein (TIGR02246 family)
MYRSLVLLLCCTPLVFSQTAEIQKILKDSEIAWNRGDLRAFASHYEDSPETTFIGRELTRGGVQAIFERYSRSYATEEKRGTLAFTEIEVRTLAPGVALATGRYTLRRSTAGGGDASGRFTLVVRQTKAGWKIIHDHSS